ncbi:Alpha/beta hydrolase [Paramicrosporidium saccamoebae]|uniref:Alpha/beta hydrolase n=1 Tax=Paramicrosporidium saccamoebae TaxID=1246581 RepID=A0A2H9TME8_9FUNG|nr:Alpha/beta hydrolase [Paramicrosporidium saccamoebae]
MTRQVTLPYALMLGSVLLFSILPNPSFASGSQSLYNDYPDNTTQHEEFWGEVLQKVNLGIQSAASEAIIHWSNRPTSFIKEINRTGAENLVSLPYSDFSRGIPASPSRVFSPIQTLTLEEVTNLDPEACTVFAKYLDPTQLQSVSKECTERLIANCEDLSMYKNSALLLDHIPDNWIMEESGDSLFAVLHINGLLSKLSFIKLSSLLSTERFCSLLKAEYMDLLGTPEYPLKFLSPECVAQIQNLDSVALTPAVVHGLSPMAFSKVEKDIHPGTISEMSEQQKLAYDYNESGFQAMDRAGHLYWPYLLSTVDNLRILPRVFEPYDIAYPIPEISLTKEIFAALAEHSPAIAGRLLVVLPILPDDILSLCGPDVLDSLRAYRCFQPINSGIDVLGILDHHPNSRQIIENISSDYCKSLSLENYVKYTWIRASLSSECREKLHFKTDPYAITQAPELADENYVPKLLPNEQNRPLTEEELAPFVADIAWTSCNTSPHPNVKCSQGLLSGISDHDPVNSGLLNVEVYRYTLKGVTPTSKVIMLAGGPGGSVLHLASLTNQVLSDAKGSVAVYHYEHRGIGTNGFQPDHISARSLHGIIFAAPFDMKYLTVENAALDVSLFAKAIERDFPTIGTRIGLLGVSYGAMLAHHVVQLFPNMFDFAVIAGVPPIPEETGVYDYNGLLLHCQLDEFCRSKIGTAADFEAVIKEVASNRHLNQCTEYLHETLEFKEQWTVGAKIRLIGEQLVPKPTEAMSVRLLLPMIKSTFDCLNVDVYKGTLDAVINLTKPTFTSTPVTTMSRHDDRSNGNASILGVVSLDYRLKDMKFDLIKAQEDHFKLFPIVRLTGIARDAYSRVGECLAGRRISQIKPAVTGKTIFVIAQNLLDLVTPFGAGRELFAKIEAPQKWFIRMNNLEHYYPDKAMANLIQGAALGGSSILSNLQSDIDAADVPIPNFWELTDLPGIKGIWDIVSDIEHKAEITQFRPILALFKEKIVWQGPAQLSPQIAVELGTSPTGMSKAIISKFQLSGSQPTCHVIMTRLVTEGVQSIVWRLNNILGQTQCAVYDITTLPPAEDFDPERLPDKICELALLATAIQNSNPGATVRMDQSPEEPELPLKMAQLFPDLFTV